MSAATEQLTLSRHDAVGLQQLKAELLAVYQVVYAERLDTPFFHPERFWERLEGYAARDGFRLVTGRLGGALVGFTLGETLPASSGWWRGFQGDVSPEMLDETGSRTFAINELQVLPEYRRRGYAKALSAELLADRTEERATLLVRAENTPAYTAYLSWGFEIIGHVQPFADSPRYVAMVTALTK
jgi:ribosomal protein S18 acetylase RimI-like enzyme